MSPSTAPGGAGVPHPAPFPKSGMSPRSGAPDRASGWIWAPSTRRHPAPRPEEVTRQCQLCNPLGWQGLGWGNLGLGILEVRLYSGDCWDTSPTHAALAALQPLRGLMVSHCQPGEGDMDLHDPPSLLQGQAPL